MTTTWPKTLPPLTPEQERVYDAFMKQWHEVLPQRYGIVERFNHSFPVRASRPGFERTLEIGAGLGEHIHHERLTAEQRRGYHALELRENMAEALRAEHPEVQVIVGDCQRRLDFPTATSTATSPSTCSSTCRTCRRACARRAGCCIPTRPASRGHPLRGQPGVLARAPDLGAADLRAHVRHARTRRSSRASTSTAPPRSSHELEQPLRRWRSDASSRCRSRRPSRQPRASAWRCARAATDRDPRVRSASSTARRADALVGRLS